MYVVVKHNNLPLCNMNPVKFRICEKCNREFPQVKIIDGKRRTFYKRKYCLECSPFGTHNTRTLFEMELAIVTIDGESCKKCISCNITKPLKEFYNKSESGRHFSICSECCKKDSKQKRMEFKKWCVDYKGGKCVMCGYDKCLNVLEFHHRNPTQKDYIISSAWKKNRNVVKLELDKCDLVCANCHGEIHEKIGF
jgi:hypothetical protein